MSSRVAKALGLLIVASLALSVTRMQSDDEDDPGHEVTRVGDTWPAELQSQVATARGRAELFLVIRPSHSVITCGIPTYPLRHYLYSNPKVPFTLVLVGADQRRGKIFLRRERLRPKAAPIRVISEETFRTMAVGVGLFMEAAGKVVGARDLAGRTTRERGGGFLRWRHTSVQFDSISPLGVGRRPDLGSLRGDRLWNC